MTVAAGDESACDGQSQRAIAEALGIFEAAARD